MITFESIEKLKSEIAEAKSKSQKRTLNVNKFDVVDEWTAIAIAKLMEDETTITNLEFGFIGATPKVGKAFAKMLVKNKVLTAINLYNNPTLCPKGIGLEGGKYITAALIKNDRLKRLQLWSHTFGPQFDIYLGAMLMRNKTVTCLSFCFNNLGQSNVKWLAKALRTNTTLTEINLGYNKLTGENIRIIAEALENNRTVTSLILTSNELCEEDAPFIARLITRNRTITSLKLDKNPFIATGLKCIIEALKGNNTLTSISLSYNKIGAESMKCIADMLRKNTKYQYVDVDDPSLLPAASIIGTEISELVSSNISFPKTKALFDRLRMPSTLQKIIFSYEGCGDRFFEDKNSEFFPFKNIKEQGKKTEDETVIPAERSLSPAPILTQYKSRHTSRNSETERKTRSEVESIFTQQTQQESEQLNKALETLESISTELEKPVTWGCIIQ